MNLQTLMLRHGDKEQPACFATVDEIDLQAPAGRQESFLSASELAQYGAMRFAPKQKSFLLGRLAAKRALGALLDEPDLRNIEIRSGVFGQPLVQHARAGRAEVTVSHSHGLAVALAYAGEIPMGVDLETVSAGSAETILGELQVSAAEKAWLAASATSVSAACGLLWTAREALGKSMKIGLNCPLGILALGSLESTDASTWIGHYANFPQSRCLSQAMDGRVLSVALPVAVELTPWPLLR